MKENSNSKIKQIVSWEHNDRYAIMYNMLDYSKSNTGGFCPFIEYRDFIFRVLTTDGKVITNAIGIDESSEIEENVLIRKEDHFLRLISNLNINDAQDIVHGCFEYYSTTENYNRDEAKRKVLAAIDVIKKHAPYFSVDEDALAYLNIHRYE